MGILIKIKCDRCGELMDGYFVDHNHAQEYMHPGGWSSKDVGAGDEDYCPRCTEAT